MPVYFFRSDPGAAELRRLARRESGRVCQRVLMIANMLEGMEHEEAARLAGLSRSAAYEWHNRYEEDGLEGLRDRPRPGRQPRVDARTSARLKERIVAGAVQISEFPTGDFGSNRQAVSVETDRPFRSKSAPRCGWVLVPTLANRRCVIHPILLWSAKASTLVIIIVFSDCCGRL